MKNFKSNTVEDWFILSLIIITSLVIASCNTVQEKSTSSIVEAPEISIHEAAFFGNAEAIKGHIAAKTDLNQKDEYGSTPLHIAATFDRTEVAILLIKAGANLSEKNADGSTPLHTAAFFGRTEIVKSLLENDADVTIRNAYNSTALESVIAPFDDVKPIYDQFSKNLGPLGLKLDYDELRTNRIEIAELIKSKK